jgi:hypothetical protein
MSNFVKMVLPSAYSYADGMPLASIVDVHAHGVDAQWMRKRAAAGVFKDVDIKPEKGKAFMHLIAMGDGEHYGANRNGDNFLKRAQMITIPNPKPGTPNLVKIHKGNMETYDTFEKYAKVYLNHDNKDPKKAKGDVEKAAHNDNMARVELIIKVPEDEWRDDLEKMARGEDVAFSMSCTVPYDICSECGNKASNRGNYCDHLTNHMGTITKQGNQICAINDHMRYFDISKVVVPADRIAFGLLKAASSVGTVSGAELAEQFNVVAPDLLLNDNLTIDKLATLRKLSEIEKEIEAVADSDTNMGSECKALNPDVFVRDLDSDSMKPLEEMRRVEIPALLGNLADMKIMLSLKDFVRLLMGSKFGDVQDAVPEAENLMPGVFGRMMSSPCSMLSDAGSMDLEDSVLPRGVRDMIQDIIPGKSLAAEPSQRRVTITVIRGGGPDMKVVKSSNLHTGASPLAERLAQAYAMYKLAFCQHIGEDEQIWTRAVLHDYIK